MNSLQKNKAHSAIVELCLYTYKFAEGKRHLLFAFIFIFIFSNIVSLYEVILSGRIFNYIQEQGVHAGSIQHICFLIFQLFVLTIVFWSLHGPARIMENKLGFYISNNFRNYLYKNTLDLSLTYHNEEHSGQIISKINKGQKSLDLFSSNIFMLIRPICTTIAVFTSLFIFDYKLGIMGILFLYAMYTVNVRFEKKINPYRDTINKKENIISEIVYDTISNITTIKMLSLSKLVHGKLNEQIDKKLEAYKKKSVLNEIKWFMPSLFSGVLIQMVLLWYVFDAYSKETVIMVGSLYIIYSLLQRLKYVMEDIAWLMSSIQDESRDMVNSRTLSDHFHTIEHDTYKQIEKVKSVTLMHIEFAYSEAFGIDVDTLFLEKGKSYAFVGESGCGKTTMMKIIASLITPSSAIVLINDISSSLPHIKNTVMLIPQEPELFSNSIRENITLGLPYTEKEVNDVLDMVNMRETIEDLPEGIESKVYEKGVNLSGGQKQRLALARGILFAFDKEVILLDEPTSSVDQDNEERIYKELMKMAHNKILISSVHKRNLLPLFDVIVYFEKGRVVKIAKQIK